MKLTLLTFAVGLLIESITAPGTNALTIELGSVPAIFTLPVSTADETYSTTSGNTLDNLSTTSDYTTTDGSETPSTDSSTQSSSTQTDTTTDDSETPSTNSSTQSSSTQTDTTTDDSETPSTNSSTQSSSTQTDTTTDDSETPSTNSSTQSSSTQTDTTDDSETPSTNSSTQSSSTQTDTTTDDSETPSTNSSTQSSSTQTDTTTDDSETPPTDALTQSSSTQTDTTTDDSETPSTNSSTQSSSTQTDTTTDDSETPSTYSSTQSSSTQIFTTTDDSETPSTNSSEMSGDGIMDTDLSSVANITQIGEDYELGYETSSSSDISLVPEIEPYYLNYTLAEFLTKWFENLENETTECEYVNGTGLIDQLGMNSSLTDVVTTSNGSSIFNETQLREFSVSETAAEWLGYIENVTTGCFTTTLPTTSTLSTTSMYTSSNISPSSSSSTYSIVSTTHTTFTTSTTTTTSTTVPQCTDGPCQNGGSYCLDSLGVYVCNCTQDYIGDLCEVLDGLSAVKNLDPTSPDSYTKVGLVVDSLIGTAVSGTNTTSLSEVSSSISDLVGNLASTSWTGEQLKTVGTSVVEGSSSILSSLLTQRSDTNCTNENGPCQDTQQTAAVVETVLESIVDLGSVVLKGAGEGTFNVQTENMNVTFNKAPIESLTQNSANGDVVIPGGLVDTLVGQEGVVFAKMDINKGIFSHASTNVRITGPIKRLSMVTDTGEAVGTLDPDDPLVINVDATSNDPFVALNLHTEGSTLTAVQEVSLTGNALITLVEFEMPPQKKVLLRGKFGELPRKYERDFEATVDNQVQDVVTHTHVRSQLYNGQLILTFETGKIQSNVVFIVLEYTDSGSSNRRRRSFSNPTMRSRTLNPKVWNPNTLTWDDNTNVQVSGISSTGKAQFKSNFFGTFAVSEFIIAPTPIDFSRLFLNFATYLKDSPYVLAVNCFLVAMTIAVAIFLRRLDKGDMELWKYYPLVDNIDKAPYSYSLSVHTSLTSSRNMTATPCFILTGSDGRTGIRILTDGCRKNFRPGTVSNFLVTTDVKLGDMNFIKIWHDNCGDSPKWHIDRIVLVDIQNNKKYLFICQKWLALGEDDGRICRNFEAFTEKSKEFSMFDILSKQKLFDDHLWLSVVKRPMYSRFSRVQRFLCAVAMLFLSMVTSAMFYQDYDSGTQKSSGLEIGPIKLNYRQVYVGAASAIIIMVPGVLMTLSFKRRKIRGETVNEERRRCGCFGYVTGKRLFPWWFVFLGYFLIVASIGASAFFTFMYSLQWGGTTSLSWLMSLFFCTTGSTALVEPVKIIVLAVALTTVFKKGVHEDIGTVAPLEIETDVKVLSIVRPTEIPEPPDEDTKDLEMRRRDLFLKNKLTNVGKSIIIKMVFVALLATICLHNDVMDSYRLNTFIKTYANEEYLSNSVGKRTDVWTWLDTVFIPALIPKRYYNNQLMSVYDQRFDSDGANIRMGPISLRQYRIKDSCDTNVLANRYGLPVRCLPDYSSETAEIGTFKEGWQACNATGTDCIEKPYKLTSSAGGSTMTTEGTFGSYGDGSYIESWDQDQRYASSRNTFLEQNNWLDSSSRALIVEVSLYNPNVGLFNRLQVLFEFPSVGGVTYNVDVKSAKLYPYVSVWDYLVLLLQLGFILTVLIRLCKFFRSVCCLRERMSCPSVMVFLLEMVLSLTAAAVYGVKIDRTIFVVEELRNNPDSFVSFDLVHLLDEIYRFTISLLLFLRILFLLEPMTLLKSLFYMKATLSSSQKELWSFGLVLAFATTAFVSLFYLLEGPITNDIRSIPETYMTLFEGLLGLVKSTQFHFAISGIEMYMKQAIFVFYFFCSSMILINIAIVILNTDLSAVQGHTDFKVGPEFDQELNNYLWRSVEHLLKKISPRSPRVSPDNDDNQEDNMKYISEKVNKITHMLDKILLKISNSTNTDTNIVIILAQTALDRLSPGRQHISHVENEVNVIKAKKRYYPEQPLSASYMAGRAHSEKVLGDKTLEPKIARLTLSVDDAVGQAWIMLDTSQKSSNDLTLGLCDVTESERHFMERELQALYGRIYKCETNYNLQKEKLNIRFHIKTERHPYEDVVIAIRSEKARNWTSLKSTYIAVDSQGTSHNRIVAVIEAQCDYIPDYITCVSESKSYIHTVSPSGGEFSLPFEPESKFFYQQGCVHSTCELVVQLIPKHPVPMVQIIPNGNLLCPIKVELPVVSGTSEYGWNQDWVVLCSTSNNHWWKVPTHVSVEEPAVGFNAYIGPANVKISFCIKVSEIQEPKRPCRDRNDPLNSDTLTVICDMVGKQWPDLGTALGLQNPHIYMMMSYPNITTPPDLCRKMVTMWYKQTPVTIDKCKHLRSALKKINRLDIVDVLDTKERASGVPFSDSVRGFAMIKAFNTVVRHSKLCESWRRLAEYFRLTQEDITQIDYETPRTNPEKTFLVLMKWCQRNSGCTVMSFQKVLIQAGFPLIAKKIDGSSTPPQKRLSLARRFSRASFMY